MHDWRVSPAREAKLNESCHGILTAEELEMLLTEYHEKSVRREAHFLEESVNADNILTGRSDGAGEVPGEFFLARLLDLTGLHRIFKTESENGRPGFEDYPRYAILDSDDAVKTWFDQRLDPASGGSDSAATDFVGLVLEVLNQRMDERLPFHPTWVAPWLDFSAVINERATRWMEVFGLGRTAQPGRWVIILRYSVREAGTLVRPTMLDGGWYAWHFPSPPPNLAPEERGGYCEDLRTSPFPARLTREFIHQQAKHSIRHFTTAGCLRGRTALPIGGLLPDQRHNHHRLLVRAYGGGIRVWMPEPI